MKYTELNIVRNLKKKLEVEEQKVSALRELVKPASVKYTRETIIRKDGKKESYTALDVSPRGRNTTSPTESLVVMIAEKEKHILPPSALIPFLASIRLTRI